MGFAHRFPGVYAFELVGGAHPTKTCGNDTYVGQQWVKPGLRECCSWKVFAAEAAPALSPLQGWHRPVVTESMRTKRIRVV